MLTLSSFLLRDCLTASSWLALIWLAIVASGLGFMLFIASAKVHAIFDHQIERHATVDLNQAPERRTLGAGHYGLAVDQERRGLDAVGSINDGREAVGPVMAVAREAADARANPAHHQAVAVLLDFVDP
jgi:hypothetical protein